MSILPSKRNDQNYKSIYLINGFSGWSRISKKHDSKIGDKEVREEEPKSLLMKVKEESKKAGLKLNIEKN